jgi:hypothetical protein
MRDVHYTTHNTQHTTHNTQHTTHNTQHTTHNTQHTTHNTQHTTHNTTYNTQHTTHSIQHTTHNTQHTTHNTQHTTHNTTQHIISLFTPLITLNFRRILSHLSQANPPNTVIVMVLPNMKSTIFIILVLSSSTKLHTPTTPLAPPLVTPHTTRLTHNNKANAFHMINVLIV